MPAPFLIKICGVTTADDAAAAAGAGAGAIGINFWPGSKRFIGTREAARAVIAAIPPGILKVGVFVNAAPAEVRDTLVALGLDRAQLHGDERAADFAVTFAGAEQARIIRALRIRDASSFDEDATWPSGLRLYDAFVEGFGGGGVPAPWPLIAARATRPFLLAGGLTPENVAEAIGAVCPDGVDTASGVETAPGRKDPAKLAAFVSTARAAAARLPPR